MRVPVPEHIPPADTLRRVHFVGIGGAALSGLARIMTGRGVHVSGSDSQDSPTLSALRELGVQCAVGHDGSLVDAADVVVVSTAVREDNPEVASARARGIAVWPRAAGVQSVLVGRKALVVTGTHGKTTTASMLATALLECGADPAYAVGSPLLASGLNAADGSGPLFVVEGDESDGAILAYTPAAAVVTNVDADHLDVYGSREAYAEVFEEFLARIEPNGFLVCVLDDPGAARLARSASMRGISVAPVGGAEKRSLRASNLALRADGSKFDASIGDILMGPVRLQVPGRVYVTDALAALAAGLQLGFDFADLARGLQAFRGTGRRMEFKGEANRVRVYDSYAHHPVEIAGDLQAARLLAQEGRLVVCFQPHLYSRTRVFGKEMGRELGAADQVVVMDVYAAREDPDDEVSGALVAAAVPLPPSRVVFEPTWSFAATRTAERASPGDLVLTLGAGDVTQIGPAVLELLSRREQEGTDSGRTG